MGKIYVPATSAEQWKQFLADPEKQWRQGYSARTLAYSWQEANGFPPEVHAVLCASPHFKDIELLHANPEHQVVLPGGGHPSQSDIWALARASGSLVSIAVEGKVAESFGPTMQGWLADAGPGKHKRLNELCDLLGLPAPLPDSLRYQLLHRTASALIEARHYSATHAVMLVHSFSQSNEWFADYEAFASLFGVQAKIDVVVSVGVRGGIPLHLAWVRGDKRFLDK
jgi:hypothetical protein